MAQNLKSSDEPRIQEDSDNLFWNQYKGPILGALLLILAGTAAAGYMWNQRTTRNNEAQALYSNARTPEAWQEVVSKYPHSPSASLALIHLASQAQGKKDFQGALGFYETFLKNFPKHPAAPAVQFAQAQLLQALGKTAEAKTAYDEIINAKPESAFFGGASVALAKLYQSENDSSRARQVLEAFTSRAQPSAYAEEAHTLLAGLSAQ